MKTQLSVNTQFSVLCVLHGGARNGQAEIYLSNNPVEAFHVALADVSAHNLRDVAIEAYVARNEAHAGLQARVFMIGCVGEQR